MRLLLLLCGCISASVPSGGYLCGVGDACPSGQHCTCGLCVARDQDSACGFELTLDDNRELEVHEHEKFNLSLRALTRSGADASGFSGTVDLSFRLPDGMVWGDVRPATVKLNGGRAQLQVTVNRETIPPQKPQLEARFALGKGNSVPVHVLPQPLTRDPMPIAKAPFGWASLAVGFPSVVWDGTQFRMYFAGAGLGMARGVGVATSSDGVHFSPGGEPLFPDPSFLPLVLSAAPYQVNGVWQLLAYGTHADTKTNDIWAASSATGLSTFTMLNAGAPVISRSSCAYCDVLVWFPSVLAEEKEWLAFFGAGHCTKPMRDCMGLNDGITMAIGRARSSDGVQFSAEPAPVLSGDMGGESYLAAPQVLKDGHIYKMWYAFARDVILNDPCLAAIRIGYATSTDGFYWVRSPSNPVLSLDGMGWEGNTRAMVPSSVVPADGKDLASGVVLYYSPLQTVLITPFCIPNGIGRAHN